MSGYIQYEENFEWTKDQLRKIATERSHLFGELSKQIIRQKLRTSRRQMRTNKERAEAEKGTEGPYHAGKFHKNRNQSGPPGGYPARQEGQLILSIGYQVRDLGDIIQTEVGSSLDYAYMLELGTSKMAARPWLTLYKNNHLGRIARAVFGNRKNWAQLEGKLAVKFRNFV